MERVLKSLPGLVDVVHIPRVLHPLQQGGGLLVILPGAYAGAAENGYREFGNSWVAPPHHGDLPHHREPLRVAQVGPIGQVKRFCVPEIEFVRGRFQTLYGKARHADSKALRLA